MTAENEKGLPASLHCRAGMQTGQRRARFAKDAKSAKEVQN
jgi:hypothetical protein